MIINFYPRSRHRAEDSRGEGKTAGTEIFSLFATVVYSSVTRDERRLEEGDRIICQRQCFLDNFSCFFRDKKCRTENMKWGDNIFHGTWVNEKWFGWEMKVDFIERSKDSRSWRFCIRRVSFQRLLCMITTHPRRLWINSSDKSEKSFHLC